MIHKHAKDQGQISLGSEVKMETKQRRRSRLHYLPDLAVGKHNLRKAQRFSGLRVGPNKAQMISIEINRKYFTLCLSSALVNVLSVGDVSEG